MYGHRLAQHVALLVNLSVNNPNNSKNNISICVALYFSLLPLSPCLVCPALRWPHATNPIKGRVYFGTMPLAKPYSQVVKGAQGMTVPSNHR